MHSGRERYRAFENLAEDEAEWSRREELFKSHGYNFRPRLRQGWIPSWHTTGKSPLHSEDGEVLRTHLVDAYTNDGKDVFIKRVGRGDTESRIAQMLNTKELRADQRNHCVPVIEIIDDPDDDSISYMVMPLLRNAYDPPFQHVGEIMDFVDQALEGLVFIHEQGVAHRDCVLHNFLMDPNTMYPDGFHPVKAAYKRDYSGRATYFPRSVSGVRYYFADFGISTHIPGEERRKRVTGVLGRDQDPPELSETVPYDPFKLDVFIIGNMLNREFCETFSNVDFILPLAQRMAAPDPEQRPTAEVALRLWTEIRETVYTVKKEWRPRPRVEHVLETAAFDAMSLCNVSMYFVRGVFEGLCRR